MATKSELDSTDATKSKSATIIPTWVNEEHFVDILKENVPGFKKIINFEPALTGGAGENYASIMLRIKIKMELEDGSIKDTAYMMKTVPQSEQGAMMVNMMHLFPKESAMYDKYLPEFEEIFRDASKPIKFGPRYFKFKNNPGADYVLLEDLSPHGFKNANRLEGLDKVHTESVLRMLAQLHAASAVRYETKGEYDADFNEGLYTESNQSTFDTMLKSLQGIILECLGKHKAVSMYKERMKTMLDKMSETMVKLCKPDPFEFNVLNHGDLWVNNIMFRYNDDGKLAETILVDYQVSRYGSPAADLYYFLMSSTNLDLKTSHFDYFIKYYHDHLEDNLKLLMYSMKIPTLKDLRMQLLKHSFWAISTLTGVMSAVLLDPNENANIDNFMKEGEEANQFKINLYSNPRYMKHMEAVLPWLDVRGLLG